MASIIIGREEEKEVLSRLLESRQSELLAIYGRRRVGKTYLIKSFYAAQMTFLCSGQLSGSTKQQLVNFEEQLHTYFPFVKRSPTPQTWQEAFKQLRECLDQTSSPKKKVLFFDELPWLDTHKSGFLSAFEYFWNMYCAQRNDLLIVICGSAASWIINKVVNNKGGLHNRITRRIRLLPFTLKETEAYLKHKNIHFDHYQLLQLYMVMGGIPHYLNAVERGKSVQQNIDSICFSKDGLLSNEFNNLYAALFNSPEKHIQLIQALAKKNKGLTRTELLTTAKLETGGGITTILDELAESGFIEKILPYNKKQKEALFRLTDEFSLFHLKFMQSAKMKSGQEWLMQNKTPSYTAWCGYAFESICMKHIWQIKKALGITGIQSNESSWYKTGDKQGNGTQIDLLLDRGDQCINICEIKFSTTPYKIDKKYAAELQNKLMVFQQDTNTSKTLLFTFITTYGLYDNEYKEQLVDCALSMEALFA